MLTALHLATILGYGLHLVWQLWRHSREYNLAWLLLACLALHLATLAFPLARGEFGFFSSLSLASWVCVALVLLWKRLAFVLVWLAPFALISSALHARVYNSYQLTSSNDLALIVHVATAIPALALALLCTLTLAYHRVRASQLKHPGGQQWAFVPALETVERLARQLLNAALLMLGLGLVTGVVFVEDFFAQHLAHKTFFSSLAWLVLLFATVSRMRGKLGWDRLFWFLLAASLLLLLGYFGSRFALEFLL